ncbi:MAG: RagB/SusD family nutrient uptake outer membrane protein [Bacteroidota bacterium]
MKHPFNTSILSLLMLFSILSCSDEFLETPPQGVLTNDNFPETPEDALAATNAMYEALRVGAYHRGFYPIDDIMSDDSRKGSNFGDQAATLNPIDQFTYTTTNEFVANWWQALYVGVRRTNVVIERASQVAMDVDLRNRYLGEARFLRALYYSDLARGYGGVPLITSSELRTGLMRATEEQTYDFIESDLRQAIELLPEKSQYGENDLGRATRGAAKALLSRVYLYQNVFDSAALYAEEVILSQQYALEPIFEDTFREVTEFGQESVFEIGGIGAEGGVAAGANQYTISQGVRGTPNRGFGFNRPTPDLINSFETNDPRLQATVIFLGEVLDGIEIIGDSGTPDETLDNDGNLIETETYNQKIWVPGNTVFSNQAHNRRLIRFAEVLLIAAEAFNEQGNTNQALVYLNSVRERAREGNDSILPDITETNRDALRDLIIEERRHELALEGHRFWDLVRTGKALEVLGPLGFQANKHEKLPIPQSERDITEGLLEQNIGWN